jgi:predicted house-cleaning noncanonical NTP pyrophosphatase (MazG superfamily)
VTGKLVRDGIPGIIRARGGEPLTRVAEPGEYTVLLRAKLAEEASEAAAASCHELAGELADVLEIVSAIADDAGLSPRDLEAVRAMKAASRGGFGGRVVWMGNEGEPGQAAAAGHARAELEAGQ